MRRAAMSSGLSWLLLVASCGGDSSPLIDAASDGQAHDGGVNEDAAIDAAAIDASAIDAAAIDAAAIDAAAIDAGAIDAAAIDASNADAAAIDASNADAAAIDASNADAAAIDAAAIDAAAIDAAAIDALAPPGIGCADGTREGFTDTAVFPGLAACAGTWTGDVALAAPLCALGWHVCAGAEPPLVAATYAQAVAFPGCFALDAAQDNWICYPGCSAAVAAGIDSATNVDMGGVGAGCPFLFPGATACVTGGRIDVSENSGTGCNFSPGITTGAACCIDGT